MSVLSSIGAAVWARRTTILVWAAIILVIAGMVTYNRAEQARVEAALSSPNIQTRDNEVLNLIQQGRLIDALTATEDPNLDAKSPQNLRSITIRENAADSVNRLIASRRIPDQQALNNLFLLRKDADAGVKTAATAGLATLGSASQANLDFIVSKLKDGDPDIRSAAVDALTKIGGAATARKIDPLLKDPAAQDSATTAMQNIGAPAVPLLIAHLSDPDPAFRQRVVTMLGQIGSPQSVPSLTREATADQPSIRRLALIALANTVLSNYNALQKAQSDAQKAEADPKTTAEGLEKAKAAVQKAQQSFNETRAAEPTLIAAVRNPEADNEARTQGALALGRLGSTADVAALVSVLDDFDTRIRLAALQGVQSVGAPAIGPLTIVLARGSVTARAAAAQALGGIGAPPAIATLQRALADPATPVVVRRSAVVGLGQSGNPAVIPSLVSALSDPDGGVASAASDALLSPSLEESAIAPLIATFTKPTPTPFNASQTLSKMGNLPVAALTAAAASPNPATEEWAAVTLGQTDSRNPGIDAALSPLTHSANAGVQYAASQALERLSGT